LLSPELLRALQSPAGQALLERAEALADDPFAAQKLRPAASPELAAAAVEQVRLRLRARSKFSRAGEMWFSPSLLEQSSGEVIAVHRARRYLPWRDSGVGDLCSGLGADATALASACRVVAVDRDPLALALTRANADALGVGERIRLICGELPGAAPRLRAAWVDPGRREAGRTRKLEAISPTLAEVLSLRESIPHLGVKLSPATDHGELDAVMGTIPHERQFISMAGECRELALWLDELVQAPGGAARIRRATLLPGGAELVGAPEAFETVSQPQGWLLEPDPAVIRAGLVANLARELGAKPIDPQLAYLTADHPVDSPFVRCYRIDSPEPFSGKALAARLRKLGASDVTFKTRGSVLQPEALRQQLRGVLKQGKADCRPVVFLTRLDSRAVMIVGERIELG
jgi:hypothetical protein